MLAAIGLPEERRLIRELLREHPAIRWDRLLFSAKESVYKTWFPLAGRWLSFEDALVDIDPLGGVFSAQLLVTGPRVNGQRMDAFSGRWLVHTGIILTAIVLPAGPAVQTRTSRGYAGA